MKKIDNDYDTNARLWWSDDEGTLSSIRYFVHPVRIAYFLDVTRRLHPAGNAGMSALDLGCGGGFLSEDLARAGLQVTGIDPSGESIRVADAHARESGLSINYLTGRGESLPFDDNSFDMVFCCDVLEHVSSVSAVIAEISRVLKYGGAFFFDTVNRTLMSRITVIYMLQECRLTAFGRPDRHVWEMFIKPEELVSILRDYGITCAELKGITPKKHGLSTLLGLYKAAHGLMTYRELGSRMQFSASDFLGGSYMGYGIKQQA